MTRTTNANEVARSLRFDSEIEKDIRLPRYPGWLPAAMRLRYYVPALAAWLFIGAIFGTGPLWWAVLMTLFALHWAAHRAQRWGQYLSELELLRGLCAGAPASAHYRREIEEAPDAYTFEDEDRKFGGFLLSRVEPFHQMRKMHARRIFRRMSRHELRAADVGCQAGDVSEEHSLAGHSAFLFDLDLEALRIARKKAGQPVVQADVGHFPIHPGALDFISFFEVIEHVDDPLAVLRELAGALAPGGRMVISTENSGCLLGFHLLNPLIVLEKAAGVYFPAILPPRNLVYINERMGKMFPHVSFTSDHVRALVEEAGLRLLWLKSYHFLPGLHRPLSWIFPAWTDGDYVHYALPVEMFLQKVPMLSRLGTNWVLACEKPAEKSKMRPGS